MNILITDMNVMVNTRTKAYFACTIPCLIAGSIKIYNLKFYENNGRYFIELPSVKYTDRKTGEIKYSKNVTIQSNELEQAILNSAIIEYKKKNKELISQVVASKASNEV